MSCAFSGCNRRLSLRGGRLVVAWERTRLIVGERNVAKPRPTISDY
jgi:hypothetical protein